MDVLITIPKEWDAERKEEIYRMLKLVSDNIDVDGIECRKISIPDRPEPDKPEICKMEPCHDSKFKGIECLETEDEFGFFKSEADQRPGHAIWIDKEDAERLFILFKYEGRLLD